MVKIAKGDVCHSTRRNIYSVPRGAYHEIQARNHLRPVDPDEVFTVINVVHRPPGAYRSSIRAWVNVLDRNGEICHDAHCSFVSLV